MHCIDQESGIDINLIDFEKDPIVHFFVVMKIDSWVVVHVHDRHTNVRMSYRDDMDSIFFQSVLNHVFHIGLKYFFQSK